MRPLKGGCSNVFSIVGGASPNSKYSENPVVMHWKSCAAISVFTTKRIMNSKIYCIIRTVKVIHPSICQNIYVSGAYPSWLWARGGVRHTPVPSQWQGTGHGLFIWNVSAIGGTCLQLCWLVFIISEKWHATNVRETLGQTLPPPLLFFWSMLLSTSQRPRIIQFYTAYYLPWRNWRILGANLSHAENQASAAPTYRLADGVPRFHQKDNQAGFCCQFAPAFGRLLFCNAPRRAFAAACMYSRKQSPKCGKQASRQDSLNIFGDTAKHKQPLDLPTMSWSNQTSVMLLLYLKRATMT